MRTLAAELAPRGIRVNTIHPGPVDNEFSTASRSSPPGTDGQAATIFDQMIPLARHAAPTEIARAMLYLASDDSSFMTGATLAVDGGMSIRVPDLQPPSQAVPPSSSHSQAASAA